MRNHVRRKTPTGPNSPTYHHRVIKGLRRRALVRRIEELEIQLKAANGETRQNMRKRLARVTGEIAEAQKEISSLKTMNENLLVQMVAHGYDREKAVWAVKEEVKS